MLQKKANTNINFFVIDERPSKCSYLPLQHCENSLFDLCQNHSSKTNFFQQILVENNKIQKTENREGVKTSKRTKFYHFYWRERTWRAGEAFPLHTWKKQKVRERDVTNAWAEVMLFGFPWFWLELAWIFHGFTMDFPFSLFTNISLNAKHFSLPISFRFLLLRSIIRGNILFVLFSDI